MRSLILLCLIACTAHAAPSERLKEALGVIDQAIDAGYEGEAQIVESAVEVYELKQAEEKAFRAELRKRLAVRRKREASWTAPNDVDRLEAAFAALEGHGIFARLNYEDCNTCALSAVHTELELAAKNGKSYRGYVFCNEQDIEGVAGVRSGLLLMSYGPGPGGTELQAVSIGDAAMEVLKAHGLTTRWSGKIEERLGVHMTWQKRRYTKAPPIAAR